MNKITNSMRRLKTSRMMKKDVGFVNIDLDQISALLYSFFDYKSVGVPYSEVDTKDGDCIVNFLKILKLHKEYCEYRLKYTKSGVEREIQSEVLSSAKQEIYDDMCEWLNDYFYNDFRPDDFKNVLDQKIRDLENKESLEIMAFYMRKIAKKTGDTSILKSGIIKKYSDNYAEVV